MLIAILVLLGLAGAIWYFARKQAQAVVTLTQEDVAIPIQEQKEAELKQAQEDALKTVKESTKKVKTMIEKIDNVLAETPVEPVVEPVADFKVTVEEPVLTPPTTETPKPPKKKRRYYPKKK